MSDNLDRMPARLRAGLAGMLAGIGVALAGLIVIAVGGNHAGSDQPYDPARQTSDIQPVDPTVPSAEVDGQTITNTIDPATAHDDDIPTGHPTVTTTAPAPAQPTGPASEPQPTLITITDNGTVIVPKPETQAPPRPTHNTVACGSTEGDPCS